MTRSYNPDNERIKRRYFLYLREAKRCSEATIDGAAKALNRFESYTRFRDFRAFHRQQAIAFKQYLAEQTNSKTGDHLSKATLHSTVGALKAFFVWLADQPGFRSRVNYSDAEYFNLSARDTAIAKAHRDPSAPTMHQVLHVIGSMPSGSEIERRDRAIVAFTLLTGMRDRALVSLPLKHVDLDAGRVVQDAREVRTKFSKTFTTYFLPVGPDVRAIVDGWIRHLLTARLWGPDDPVFPRTRVVGGVDHHFAVAGIDRKYWTTANPVRAIFRRAFENAGLRYFAPHSIRTTLARLGEQVCRTPEEFKAWSQNLGHDKVLTTFSSYGEVPSDRQADIIRSLGIDHRHDAAAADQIVRALRSAGLIYGGPTGDGLLDQRTWLNPPLQPSVSSRE